MSGLSRVTVRGKGTDDDSCELLFASIRSFAFNNESFWGVFFGLKAIEERIGKKKTKLILLLGGSTTLYLCAFCLRQH